MTAAPMARVNRHDAGPHHTTYNIIYTLND